MFDTVAVYLAYSQDLLVMEDLPLRVTNEGYAVIDKPYGRIVHCATGWRNLSAFEDKLVVIITNKA